APGQEATADFDLKARSQDDSDPRPALEVEVQSPDGRGVEHARVAIWPLSGAKEGKEPLVRGETGRNGVASIALQAPAKGDYLVAAGNEEYAEGHAELREFEANPKKPERVKVILGRGAVVRALAKDEKGAPLNAIELHADRSGDPAPSLLK